jgi:hypothetical protein
METAAIICAAAGLVVLVVALLALARSDADEVAPGGWRERTADTAADFRDWLRLGR